MRGYLIFFCAAFLSGSVMYSYILPRRFCGIDVRKNSEDGNPGTANVFSQCGVKLGSACLALDVAKGFAPVAAAGIALDPGSDFFYPIIAAPVIGSAFSPFLKGRGGKSIAVTAGALLGAYRTGGWWILYLACLLFFTLILDVKPNSLKMIVSSASFALISIALAPRPALGVSLAVISGVAVFKHVVGYNSGAASLKLGPEFVRRRL